MRKKKTLKRLKADGELRSIPVVIISVVAGEGRGRLLGAADLITKPFERDDLLRVVWRHLVRRSSGSRLLLVAEEGAARDQLAESLTARGIEVFTAPDAIDAIEELRTEVPDAMLLDATAPSVAAVRLLERIRGDRVHQGLPVVAWVSSSMPNQVRERVEELATAVIPEDHVPGQLNDVLSQIFPSFEAEEAGR